ncbi:hypothetical protein FOA52_006552 [Chlamydomonas sp. UWO 241]|nr:hypothetical protein FOA52_006552 [Chlamydomonas sp. UWO 241]
MQSHASRHVASEFLKDRHPDLSPPFPSGVIPDEIAEAYGRKGVVKLVNVLSLPASDLSDEKRAHALRVLIGLLSTQEQKLDAVSVGGCAALTTLVKEFEHAEVLRLSCEALGSLAQVQQGRVAIVTCGGVTALDAALEASPSAAAGALRTFAFSCDGAQLLGNFLEPVVPSLAATIDRAAADTDGMRACINAATALASLCTTDAGILSCLKHYVPACIVRLAGRCLTGDFKFESDLNECYEAVADCLEQIAHQKYGKTAVREAGAIPVLAQLLEVAQWHAATVKKATAALMATSVEKDSKLPIVESAGAALVRLLKSSDEANVPNARATLVSCAEHLPARAQLGSHLNAAEQVVLLFQGPLPPTPPDFRYEVRLPYKTGDE